MKRCITFAIVVFLLFACKKNHEIKPAPQPVDDTSQLKNYEKDIIIANWNIEWFGDASMFKRDLNIQEANAGKILKYINADLYGLCEIVDTARFGRMIRNNLSDDYRYVIASYITFPQKLAFVYNKHIFRKISVRPFMGVSTQAYTNFAFRYPFILTAKVAVNGA